MQQGPRLRFSVRSGSLSIHPPLQARVKHIGNSVSLRQTYTKLPRCHYFVVKNLEMFVSPVPASVWKRNDSPGLILFSSFSFITLSQYKFKNKTTYPPLPYVEITLWGYTRSLQNNATYSYSFILGFGHPNLCVYMCTHSLLLHYQGAVMDLI